MAKQKESILSLTYTRYGLWGWSERQGSHWHSYQLGYGCETITPPNLEETLERWQGKQ